MFQKLLNARREKKLGEAIANHDLRKMEEYLSLGVTKVDYMQMRMADYGDGTLKVPACKFEDPWLLAQAVGLGRDGVQLLYRYIPNEEIKYSRKTNY